MFYRTAKDAMPSVRPQKQEASTVLFDESWQIAWPGPEDDNTDVCDI